LEEKRVLNKTNIPPTLKRLAAVLAEIARNEPNSISTIKPVCASNAKIKEKSENPQGG
jgi:hypothetical protein